MLGVAPVSMLYAMGLASLALHTADTDQSAEAAAASEIGPRAQQPLSQDGVLIAVSGDSLTARSANGYTRTYLITPGTTVITGQGGQPASTTTHLRVNERVEIVGTTTGGGTAFATAISDRDLSHGGGPPMDADG
jgi:hypothetical protein